MGLKGHVPTMPIDADITVQKQRWQNTLSINSSKTTIKWENCCPKLDIFTQISVKRIKIMIFKYFLI